MIYITGDTHREFYRLHNIEKNKNNMLIILGDTGINYYLDERDKTLKEQLNSYNIKLFCVQGNHEERPENILTYKKVLVIGGAYSVDKNYRIIYIDILGLKMNNLVKKKWIIF